MFSSRILALFLTRHISLSRWQELGILDREAKYYTHLAQTLRHLYIVTPGNRSDKKFASYFSVNTTILTRPGWMPRTLYTFFAPIIHRRVLLSVDIAKTNQMDGSWTAVITKKFFNTALVIRCGYEWLQTLEKSRKVPWKRWIAWCVERFAYRNADRIILTSEEAKHFVIDRFTVPAQKISIIPNFVDTDLFKSLPIQKEPRRIIAIGRLEPEKNILALVEALKGLDASLVLIGTGSLRSTIKSRASLIGVHVEFMGVLPQSRIVEELNKSSIYILPSLYEGNPKTLLEAMACGICCIGVDVPGINTLITNNETGLLCGTGHITIAAALKQALENESLRLRLGAAAREKVVRYYGLPVILQDELSVYTTV